MIEKFSHAFKSKKMEKQIIIGLDEYEELKRKAECSQLEIENQAKAIINRLGFLVEFSFYDRNNGTEVELRHRFTHNSNGIISKEILDKIDSKTYETVKGRIDNLNHQIFEMALELNQQNERYFKAKVKHCIAIIVAYLIGFASLIIFS